MNNKIYYFFASLFALIIVFGCQNYQDAKQKDIQTLIRYLKSEDISVQDIGVKDLSLLGDKAVAPLLVFTIREGRDSIGRKNGVLCLGQIRSSKSALALISLFKKTKDMPQLVVSSLVNIGEPAIEPLVNSSYDNDKWVRELILDALSDIIKKMRNNTGTVKKVKTVFINAFLKDPSLRVRETALFHLVPFKDEGDVRIILLNALHDKEPKIRELAKEILRKDIYRKSQEGKKGSS